MYDWQVKTLDNPTIKLDQLSITDYNPNKGGLASKDNIKTLGDTHPFIKIRNYVVDKSAIVSFNYTVNGISGMLPTMNLELEATGNKFLNAKYPLDGEIVSVYVRSHAKELKAVRNDFVVEAVYGDPTTDGSGGDFSISGYLHVPGLFEEENFAYTNKTSFEVLREIAAELGLGFASNVANTDDRQNWICAYDTRLKFIYDVATHAFLDDDSFFTVFIDQYYILNFVEINRLFNVSDDLELAKVTNIMSYEDYDRQEAEEENVVDYLILSNDFRDQTNNNYIRAHTLQSNTGVITRNHGYRRYCQFYDKKQKEYVQFFAEGLNTPGTENMVLLKGRPDSDDYKKGNKYKWLGMLVDGDSGNMHSNYFYSKIHNIQNIQEIYKIVLDVELGAFNPNILRYQRMPVVIFNRRNQSNKQTSEEDTEAASDLDYSVDKFLTGVYLVSDFSYSYEMMDKKVRQTVSLLRREFKLNPETVREEETQRRIVAAPDANKETKGENLNSKNPFLS